jgi:hypothetical protein
MTKIAAIDIGVNNMGMAVAVGDPHKVTPYFERSTIMITKSGLERSEYSEAKVVRLTIMWLEERRKIWTKLRGGIVFPEKMMVKQEITQTFDSLSQAQRCCHCVEMTMRTWFHVEFLAGRGPLAIFCAPRWWQNRTDLNMEQFKHLPRAIRYKKYKEESIARFKQRPVITSQPGLWEELSKRFGPNIGDVAESYDILLACHDNLPELLKKELIADLYDNQVIVTPERDFLATKIKKVRFESIEDYRAYLLSLEEEKEKDTFPVDYHWRRFEQTHAEKKETPLPDTSSWKKRPFYSKKPKQTSKKAKKS